MQCGVFEMLSTEAWEVSTMTLFGGLATWVIAWAFDYLFQDHRYKLEKGKFETAAKYDKTYDVSGVEDTLATRLAGKPRCWETGFKTAVQPLLVLALVTLGSFRIKTVEGYHVQMMAVWWAVAVLVLTALHELKGRADWIGMKSYRTGLIAAWILQTVLICGLVRASIDAKSEQATDKAPAPAKGNPEPA